MKHDDFARIYLSHINNGEKLKAIKFFKDIVNECQKYLGPGTPEYIGLKEAYDLITKHDKDYKGVLTEIKLRWPKVYKRMNFVKINE